MIHITQCLCENRHTILAAAWDDRDPAYTAEHALADLKRAVELATEVKGIVNPWCGICHSRNWHYEDGVTKFTSMAEAWPSLKECEREQMEARAAFGDGAKN